MASGIPQTVTDQADLTRLQTDEWLKYDVFSVGWWILLILLVAAFAVWLKLLDKSRLKEKYFFSHCA